MASSTENKILSSLLERYENAVNSGDERTFDMLRYEAEPILQSINKQFLTSRNKELYDKVLSYLEADEDVDEDDPINANNPHIRMRKANVQVIVPKVVPRIGTTIIRRGNTIAPPKNNFPELKIQFTTAIKQNIFDDNEKSIKEWTDIIQETFLDAFITAKKKKNNNIANLILNAIKIEPEKARQIIINAIDSDDREAFSSLIGEFRDIPNEILIPAIVKVLDGEPFYLEYLLSNYHVQGEMEFDLAEDIDGVKRILRKNGYIFTEEPGLISFSKRGEKRRDDEMNISPNGRDGKRR